MQIEHYSASLFIPFKYLNANLGMFSISALLKPGYSSDDSDESDSPSSS